MSAPQPVGTFDVVVVGGGPAGATAADELARRGTRVLLLDRGGRIKPCGGAIPPRLVRDFAIPDELLAARISSARMVAPSARTVDMPIENGFVGMVDRDVFDEWLRRRAASSGAERRMGRFVGLKRDADGTAVVQIRAANGDAAVRARVVVGADGARSAVAAACIPGADRIPCVFAYHEIVQAPTTGFDGTRCDVYYQGRLSPDFYGWVFPHRATVSIGCGTARKGFPLRAAVAALRESAGLTAVGTVRCEGAPIPLRPLRRWDNGRDVIVAGDAAGVVAPASGEGIYYAMESGRLAAEAAAEFLKTGDPAALRNAHRRFMRAHGRVFWILRVMQRFWYSSDRLREHFVSICRDREVQRLTWDAYMNKRLSRGDPLSHIRIFLKDLMHWLGLASA